MIAMMLAQAVALTATEVRRIPAEEARQGVAADERFVYAIDNSRIGKYDRRTGKRIGGWSGDPARFKHMNSCTLVAVELVCAASNYPDVPQASSVEWFDTRTMRHVRTRSIGPGRGSLTWLEWHGGHWWAGFAHYDGKGGEPGRDHRYTSIVKYSPAFVEQGAWLLPSTILERMKPYSNSGGTWCGESLLLTGHDRPEVYVVHVPDAGSTLLHRTTFIFPSPGQAIQCDQSDALWSIDRGSRALIESRLPAF